MHRKCLGGARDGELPYDEYIDREDDWLRGIYWEDEIDGFDSYGAVHTLEAISSLFDTILSPDDVEQVVPADIVLLHKADYVASMERGAENPDIDPVFLAEIALQKRCVRCCNRIGGSKFGA